MLTNRQKIIAITATLCLLLTLAKIEGAQAADTIEPLPRDLEIELALSSLPPHLRDNATVYVLKFDQGYEVVREGANGFHAFVARTSSDVYKGSWPFTEYPDDLLIPIAYDRAGAKENMRPLFDMAKMRAEGVAPGAAKKMIHDRYKTGFYKAPERAGISYMLSPVLRAYMDPDKSSEIGTFNFPHYMFYAPNVSNEDIGGSLPPAVYPWAFRPGPHGFINLRAGEREIADINKEYEGMLARLCKIKEAFCLPEPNAQ